MTSVYGRKSADYSASDEQSERSAPDTVEAVSDHTPVIWLQSGSSLASACVLTMGPALSNENEISPVKKTYSFQRDDFLIGDTLRIALNEAIDLDEPVWRYFKPNRFQEFLATGELYFASARQFQDPFEGAVAVLPPGFPVDPRYTEREGTEKAFEELRRLTKINCWHRATYESDAMWQLYAGEWKGVAIRTTPGRIAEAAKPFRLKPEYGQEQLWAGYVRYVDLLKERLRVDMLDRFWYKHMAFSWEREFRLAISLRMAEEYGVQVPEDGIRVSFDVSQLVGRIFIGPSLDAEDVKVVRKVTENAGLGDRVRLSSMLGSPRYR